MVRLKLRSLTQEIKTAGELAGMSPEEKRAQGTSPLMVFFLTILHMLIWHLALGADIYLRRWA